MTRAQQIALWVILLVGFGLRLWMMIAKHDHLVSDYDDKMYLLSARVLLKHGIFSFGTDCFLPTVFIPPLFVLYLTGVFAIFGPADVGMWAAQVGIAMMGTGSLALLAKLGAQVRSWTVGLIAAAILALYPSAVLVSVLYMTEMMFTMWVLCFFILLLRAIESERTRDFVWAGVFLGLATLTRPTFALMPVVVGLYLFGRRDYGLVRAFRAGMILVVTLFVCLSPWIVRNYVDFHKFIPLTKASGNPFLTGTYYNNDVWGDGHDPQFPDMPKGWKKVVGNQQATDALLMSIGEQRLRAELIKSPRRTLHWYTIGKIDKFWSEPFDWMDNLKPWWTQLKLAHQLLLVLGFVGFIAALFRGAPYMWLFFLFFSYFDAIHMVYVTLPRYAFPLMPYVFLFVALLLREGLQRRQS